MSAGGARGARAPACGALGKWKSKHSASVTLDTYPGYTAGRTIKGMLTMRSMAGSDSLKIQGIITGLEASATGGWHVHEGFSCDTAGGHYYEGLETDSWLETVWHASSRGVAVVDMEVAWGCNSQGFSLRGAKRPPPRPTRFLKNCRK